MFDLIGESAFLKAPLTSIEIYDWIDVTLTLLQNLESIDALSRLPSFLKRYPSPCASFAMENESIRIIESRAVFRGNQCPDIPILLRSDIHQLFKQKLKRNRNLDWYLRPRGRRIRTIRKIYQYRASRRRCDSTKDRSIGLETSTSPVSVSANRSREQCNLRTKRGAWEWSGGSSESGKHAYASYCLVNILTL